MTLRTSLLASLALLAAALILPAAKASADPAISFALADNAVVAPTFYGTVPIAFRVDAPAGVRSFSITAPNSALSARYSADSPWMTGTLYWQVAGLPNGSYTITATATDYASPTGTATRTLTLVLRR